MQPRPFVVAVLLAGGFACRGAQPQQATKGAAVDSAAVPVNSPRQVAVPDSMAAYAPVPLDPPAVPVPLAQGVILVSALHTEEGDRENTVMIGEVSPEGIDYTWKYRQHRGIEEIEESALERFVSAADFAGAPRLNSIFRQGGGREETPGYTAMTLSRASFNQVHDQGRTPYTIKATPRGSSNLTDAIAAMVTMKGALSMVGTTPESVSVLLNGDRTSLPALHLRGVFDFQEDHREADYWVFADSIHPLILRVTAGARSFQMVRIETPEDKSKKVEQRLEQDCRAELPGIYFAFASADLQPASDPAIKGVADLLGRHPDWTLAIEGHTDSIGNPASNQSLSMARAEAVRRELITRHTIAEGRLRAAGFGAIQPRETNTTLEGRARNRRVEVVRSCANPKP